MGVWDQLLHPRANGGEFGPSSHATFGPGSRLGSKSAGGGGGKGGRSKKVAGPSKAEAGIVGQVEAGNVYTTDGGHTWNVLGSKTPGTATTAVQRAMHDHLLSAPGKGSNHPGLTPAGVQAFKSSGRPLPAAKAPILARRAANTAARALKQRQAQQRAATLATKRAASAKVTSARAATQAAAAGRAASQPRTVTPASPRGVRSTVSAKNRAR